MISKRNRRWMIGAAALIAACGGGSSPLAPTPAPSPAATRDGRFIQDIEALATDLPRLHANLFFKIPRSQFEAEVATLKTKVSTMRDAEVVAGLMRLAALPGDAHTAIYPSSYAGFRRLPIRLTFLSDGLTVTAAAPGGAALLGGVVTQIGDADAATVIERMSPLVSRDNDAWLRAMLPGYAVVPELLHAQGLVSTSDLVRIRVRKPGGDAVEASLAAVPSGQEGAFADAGPSANPPLYRQRSSENYWFTITNSNVVYVQYNRCQDAASDPMTAFAARVLAEIDRRAPTAVVIDLRGNGGGNSAVLDPLLSGLRARAYLAQSGRLFALIGENTFSSALLNAITLKRDLGAILVGDPTGGKPNGYGEVKAFTLPNSALSVSYSTRFFNAWPDGDPPSLPPDIPASLSAADYLAGRDPAMLAVEARVLRSSPATGPGLEGDSRH